jgi:dynein heavy chain, axonemal
MDHQGWYDRTEKSKPFKKIEDIIFVSAMGPPGGGRSDLTQRMQRHFNFLTYTNLGSDSISMIFRKILKAFVGHFSDSIDGVINGLVDSTQNIFNAVAATLRPTPSKSHYTFNLRDISKVMQGVCAADPKET